MTRELRTREGSPTRAQLRVLGAFADLEQTLGWPPSMREVANRCGFKSINAIVEAYERLACRGLLNYERNSGPQGAVARRVTLTELGKKTVGLVEHPFQIGARLTHLPPTGTVALPWRCPYCKAETFAPDRGCWACGALPRKAAG